MSKVGTPEEAPGKGRIKCGKAEVVLDYDFAKYLAEGYYMPLHIALLKVNVKLNPYSCPIGWKLCTLYNINYDKPARRGRTTVKTILDAVKAIPRYDEISSKGQIYNRIIAPFNRDLQNLVSLGMLSYCYYETPDGERIEGDKLGKLSYLEFSSLYVFFELKAYPDQTKRLEKKNMRIKSAINRNIKRAVKRKAQAEEGSKGEG